MAKFKSKNPHFEFLRKRWTGRQAVSSQNLLDKHLRHITLGSLGGLALLSSANISSPSGTVNNQTIGMDSEFSVASSNNRLLATELIDKLPRESRNLTDTENDRVISLIQKDLGVKVKSEIDGIRLNRTIGLIGGEQHLYRYPGDTIFEHAKDSADWAMYSSAGVAPGLGAWGYFAPSKSKFTAQDQERERYYIAVQTFLAPGFAENVSKYRDFFKYRKMLVVNPKTGQSVVTDIGDAGPGESTGKHLGGSPEVMHHLGLGGGPRKGEVLYYFIDDSNANIPLGPLEIKQEVSL